MEKVLERHRGPIALMAMAIGCLSPAMGALAPIAGSFAATTLGLTLFVKD